MITGTHAMLFSADPVATRTFLRDVLELPNVDDEISLARYGRVTHFSVPGAGSLELYEPSHALAKDLPR